MRHICFLLCLAISASLTAQSRFSIPISFITLDALDAFQSDLMSSDLLDPKIMRDLSCFGDDPTPIPYQWLNWVMPKSGQFKFEISPLNYSDDIDFVLFMQAGNELIPLRKMTAGSVLNDFISLQCIGSTGLLDATQSTNTTSCISDNNYLKPLNAVEGANYFLLITNATSYNGFFIDFSGNASAPDIAADENFGTGSIFPNPTDGWISFNINSRTVASGTFTVMDISGKTLKQIPLNISEGSQVKQFDLTSVPKGQIICKIIIDTETVIQYLTKY